MATAGYTLETVYLDAIKQIKDLRSSGALSDAESDLLTGTTQPQDLLVSIQDALQRKGSISSLPNKIKAVVEMLLLRLERFSSAIDVLAQSSLQVVGINPVGLVWGSIKLIIVIAQDLANAFDILSSLLGDITKALPTLSAYVAIFGSSDIQLLKEPLVTIYAEFIRFSLQAVKLCNRSTLSTLGRSAWKSLQDEAKLLASNTEKAGKEVDRIAAVEHMHQTNQASKVQLLENQNAEEFRHHVRSLFAGSIEYGVGATSSQPSSFNAAPTDLLSVHFSGRDKEVVQIHSVFALQHGEVVRRCAIFGVPGVGKTQLALHYARDSFPQSYKFIFWISANTTEKLNQGLANLLNLVGHADRNHPEQSARLIAARRWLEDCPATGIAPWLLVIDNVNKETLAFLREHLPRTSHGGDVLFTTRTEDVARNLARSAGTEVRVVDLRSLEVRDAAKLLLRDAGIDADAAPPTTVSKAEELVGKVGCLPLAVDQAASFMRQKKNTIEELLTLYGSENKTNFVNWENDLATYEQRSIAATFTAQLDELEKISPVTSDLMRILAFLDFESIPMDFLSQGALAMSGPPKNADATVDNKGAARPRRFSIREKIRVKLTRRSSNSIAEEEAPIPEALLILMTSAGPLREAILQLQSLSLVDQQHSGNVLFLHMHDLVQHMVQAHTKLQAVNERSFKQAVALICVTFDMIEEPTSPSSWARCEPFIPHIQALAKYGAATGIQDQRLDAANLAVANYFRARGRYAEAEVVFQETLTKTEKLLGSKAPRTLQAMQDVASVYRRQGRYNEAEKLLKRVLDEQMGHLGPENPETLRTAQTLSNVYMELGQFRGAEKLCKKTLARCTTTLGTEHPDTHRTTQTLALILERKGQLDKAETLYERALNGRRTLLGAEHADTQRTLHNLAIVYSRQGRFDEARSLYEQALRWREEHLGPQHPDTLQTIQNLAVVCAEKREDERAEELYTQALAGWRQQYYDQPEHPEILQTIQNFAILCERRDDFAQAEELYKTASGGYQSQLGPEHPSTLRTVHNLAVLYERQGRYSEAEALFAKVLAGREKRLGSGDVDTVRTRTKLARLREESARRRAAS